MVESILERITAAVMKDEVNKQKTALARSAESPVMPDFNGDFFIIAEVKRKSPSKGILREDFDPVALTEAYISGGASAISVITEPNFFGGSPDHLARIREITEIPILRKDFILTESQVQESYNLGADMVLLIAACLNDHELRKLQGLILELGMTPLVEVHSRGELERALLLESSIVGINNRNLTDFTVDLNTSLELAGHVPEGVPLISESGIRSARDVSSLRRKGFSGILVGEHLLTSPSPGEALRELRDA